jgi:PTH1 family peptidyl-tRNA hydrolase
VKLVVGLGNNPRKKYKNTRHNTGFWLVDLLKEEIEGQEVVFFKNSGFINNSGTDVKKTINHLRVPLEDLLVVHDDFDLELGQFKLQSGRSSAGHKGVQSVIDELDSQDFWRLRVGVGRPPEGVEVNEYVLEHFSSSERQIIDSIYSQILAAVKDWVLKKQ